MSVPPRRMLVRNMRPFLRKKSLASLLLNDVSQQVR